MSSEILLFIIQLVIGGLVAFLAILTMSKNRDAYWMCMVSGFLCLYAARVFELLVKIGVLAHSKILLFNIPLSELICVTLPFLLFITGFIIYLAKKI